MNAVAEDSQRVADWDSPEPLRTGVSVPLLLPLLPAALLGALAAFLGGPMWGVVAVLGVAAGVLGWIFTRGRASLSRLGARPIAAGQHPRLENLVAGLSGDLDLTPPSLWLIPNGAPNAAVVWNRGAHLAVTSALLERCPLTQLESVVAHCLVRIATGEARRSSLALGWGPLASSFVRVGYALDTRTAALTRYPPALAAAIRLCEPISDRPIWFVGRGPCYAGREDRAAALNDL